MHICALTIIKKLTIHHKLTCHYSCNEGSTPMEKLSVVIITKNEEKNIERCITSVEWADEIIVLDTGSTDATLAICAKHRCRIERTEWSGFGPAKQKAVSFASHTWILSIDADEEICTVLRDEIRSVLADEAVNRKDAYRLKRQSWYINRWIRHSGWNKDAPVRLFNRNKAGFNGKLIHESVNVHGTIGKTTGVVYHYSYPDLITHLHKISFFSGLIADQRTGEGKQGSISNAILHGCMKFFKMFFLQAGFLDGKTGFILAINSAFSVYFKHLMHWERSLQHGISHADPSA